MSYRRQQLFAAAGLLLPALILYVVFFVLPLLYAFGISFMEGNLFRGDLEFAGLDNYQAILNDNVFWISLRNTVVFVLGTIPVSMIIALVLAELVESVGSRARQIYRFLLFLPVVASLSVVGTVWLQLLSPSVGYVNQLLRVFGIQGVNWLNEPNWALPTLIVIAIWKNLGIAFVIYVAGLTNMDDRLLEAASLDGAGRWGRFWRVKVPLLIPIHIFLLVLGIISSFQNFGLVHIMTQGGPNNATNILVYQIWQEAFRFFDFGRSTALSMIVFAALLILTILQIRLVAGNNDDAGAAR